MLKDSQELLWDVEQKNNKTEDKSVELQRKIDYGTEDYKSAGFVVDQSIFTCTLFEQKANKRCVKRWKRKA